MQQVHITLEQLPAPDKQGAMVYLVTETRNTIQYRIGEMLSASEVKQLPVAYTVKKAK